MAGETTYRYPTGEELMAIEPDMQDQLQLADPIFELFPVIERNVDTIAWEQRDNFLGLQQVRGLGGAPASVKKVGAKKYTVTPGVYGEEIPVDEAELTQARPLGVTSGFLDLEQSVLDLNKQLAHRENNLLRYVLWTLLGTGTFSVQSPGGVVMHTDRFDLQTYTRAVDWTTVASATPLADFRGVQALAAGHGVNLGGQATAWMNRANFNEMCSNTNANDLAGKRVTGLAQPIGLEAMNAVLLAEDLPQIRVYDEGYYDDDAAFHRFIPANTVIITGKRLNGDPLGNYIKTRNATNPDAAPGTYVKVVDNAERGDSPVPRRIAVHRGHNGGPVIYYPGSIVVMTV